MAFKLAGTKWLLIFLIFAMLWFFGIGDLITDNPTIILFIALVIIIMSMSGGKK